MAHPNGEDYKATWSGNDIGGITGIDPNTSIGEIEKTDFDSGNHKEFDPGDIENTVSLEIQVDPADSDFVSARSDWQGRVKDTLTIEPKSPSTGQQTFSATAFATELSPTYNKEEKVVMSVSFRIDGEPTITTEP